MATFQFSTGFVRRQNLLLALQKDPTIELAQIEASDGRSYLGTLVYDELIIESGSFLDSGITGPPTPYEGLKMHSVLVEVNQSKNIVTTSLQGRNGTVKEYIADGDYSIIITGVIIGVNTGDLTNDVAGATIEDLGNFYPEVDVARLAAICRVSAPIILTSEFLQFWGISDCVITSYNIPQREGTRNMQPFQLTLLSDTPIELNELAVE